jgi:hypothetical protein
MDYFSPVYWPFAVWPAEERTESQRHFVGFFEDAFSRGWNPYRFGADNVGAISGTRSGEILSRGTSKSEIVLSVSGKCILTAYVTKFEYAGNALLDWLEGKDVGGIVDQIRNYLVPLRPGHKGYVLETENGRD